MPVFTNNDKSILSGFQFAPIIDSRVVIQSYHIEYVMLLVDPFQIAAKMIASQGIKRTDLRLYLRMFIKPLHHGGEAQLPLGGQTRCEVVPRRFQYLRPIVIAERHPAAPVTR